MAASVKIAPIQQVMLNVTLDSYGTFIDKLRYALAGPNPDKVKERPVLAKETGPDVQPPRWIHVQLNAKGDVAPTVAIRSDNVYIMGFTNSRGTWYQLNETGYEYKLVDDRAVMLGFNGSYAKLLPDPVRGLKTLNLSRFQGVSDAAAKLWKWNSKANTYGDDADIHDDDNDQETAMVRADPQKDLRKAVATLAMAISEAARFIAISEVISKGWDCYRVCIDEEVGYIMRFGHLSEALLLWRQKGYKDDQTIFQNFGDIGIRNGEQALAVVALVKLIIRSTVAAPTGFGDAPSDEQLLAYAELPKHGRYMAEVFSVRIPAAAGGGAPPSGTISFHGGHYCSDFIYSRSPEEEHTYCDSQGNIVLTGPSVAMSACSPIVFSLDLHDGSRGISPQAGRVACDAVGGDFSNYDRAIVETVETGYGPAEVIYAVLSNGVQGRVAMKLARLEARDGEDGGVLGRIVARSKLFDVGCVLFYNEADKQGVRVPPGELLPLVREALAVPLHMPLTIELGLRRCSGDDIVTGELEFNPEIDGQQTQRLVGVNGAELEVTITWSEYPW